MNQKGWVQNIGLRKIKKNMEGCKNDKNAHVSKANHRLFSVRDDG
jgi:hypothetical protein